MTETPDAHELITADTRSSRVLARDKIPPSLRPIAIDPFRDRIVLLLTPAGAFGAARRLSTAECPLVSSQSEANSSWIATRCGGGHWPRRAACVSGRPGCGSRLCFDCGWACRGDRRHHRCPSPSRITTGPIPGLTPPASRTTREQQRGSAVRRLHSQARIHDRLGLLTSIQAWAPTD